MNIYEQVKQALQDVVAPELKVLQVETKRLDDRMNSLKAELTTEIKRLDEKVDSSGSKIETQIKSMDTRISTEIKRLDEKIDIAIQIRERLVALETKFAAMER